MHPTGRRAVTTVYRVAWEARYAPEGRPLTLVADYSSEAEAEARVVQLVDGRSVSLGHVLVYTLDVTP